MAKSIQQSLKTVADRENRREAKANDSYYMLKRTGSPAVIVECGFLSNPDEAEKLKKSSYQRKLVEAIYQGICIYQENAEKAQKN